MICLQVLFSYAEDNEKNASIEEGLTACVEAKVRSIKLCLEDFLVLEDFCP